MWKRHLILHKLVLLPVYWMSFSPSTLGSFLTPKIQHSPLKAPPNQDLNVVSVTHLKSVRQKMSLDSSYQPPLFIHLPLQKQTSCSSHVYILFLPIVYYKIQKHLVSTPTIPPKSALAMLRKSSLILNSSDFLILSLVIFDPVNFIFPLGRLSSLVSEDTTVFLILHTFFFFFQFFNLASRCYFILLVQEMVIFNTILSIRSVALLHSRLKAKEGAGMGGKGPGQQKEVEVKNPLHTQQWPRGSPSVCGGTEEAICCKVKNKTAGVPLYPSRLRT